MKFLSLMLQNVYDTDANLQDRVDLANRIISDRLNTLNSILQIQHPILIPWSESAIQLVEENKHQQSDFTDENTAVILPKKLNPSQQALKEKVIKRAWRLLIFSGVAFPIIGSIMMACALSMDEAKDKNGNEIKEVSFIGKFIASLFLVLLPFSLSVLAVNGENSFFKIIGYVVFAILIGVFFSIPKIIEAYAQKKLTVDAIQEKYKQDKKEREKQNEMAISAMKSLRKQYLEKDPITISLYVSDIISENHSSSGLFDTENEVSYIEDTCMAVVDCLLPSPDEIPSIKEYRYIKSRNEAREVLLTAKEKNALYDSLLYQICLSDIRQIFTTDTINKIDSIVYNAWISFIDKGTGNHRKACILSLQVSKKQYQEINFQHVDPKDCFRYLGGVGNSKLHNIVPIAPIMKINTEDSRFIVSYDVAHTLDESVNLAAMDWKDFEHLVRETFSKFFSSDDVDVKVTQSSKDRGVDAIAFDPDPIRGGKIVIQAKRYTNVVGVSAVRDLYGTVMNEGAMKGILVTTSHFGGDAYEFAKGKPLTLISGGELLNLLNEHGYKARINLKEAKTILNEREKNIRLVHKSDD